MFTARTSSAHSHCGSRHTETSDNNDVRRRLLHVPLAMGRTRGRCNSVCTRCARFFHPLLLYHDNTDVATVANAVESVQERNKEQVSVASTLDDRTQPSEHLWILPWGPTLGAHFLPRRLPPSLCFARSAHAAPLQRLPYLLCHPATIPNGPSDQTRAYQRQSIGTQACHHSSPPIARLPSTPKAAPLRRDVTLATPTTSRGIAFIPLAPSKLTPFATSLFH